MKLVQDYYFHQAKRENYPARSIYKLKEIHKHFKVFRPGMKVLDLGAAPGSWSLGAAEYIGPSGFVLGLDIKAAERGFPPQVHMLQGDIFSPSSEFMAAIASTRPFDLVMSDLAPSTTGHRSTDQARSAALIRAALEVALAHLVKGGHFIVKFFMGPEIKAFSEELRRHFDRVKSFKPKSSRSESYESFYIALGFKAIPPPDPGA